MDDLRSELLARLECYRWLTLAADKMIANGSRSEVEAIRAERDKMLPRIDELKAKLKETDRG